MKPANILHLLLSSILVFAMMAGCSSCKTNTPDANANARGAAVNQTLKEAGSILGKVATQVLFDSVRSEATGTAINYQQSAAGALWANVNLADSAASVRRIVDSYSANKTPVTATAAEKAFDESNSDPAKKVNAIAAVISAATGAPPK